jgi:hypothetical protein
LIAFTVENIGKEDNMHFKFKTFFIIILAICLPNIVSKAIKGEDTSKRTGLVFWNVGNKEGMDQRFGTSFYKTLKILKKNKNQLDCFLCSIAEQPLAKKEILKKCNILPSQLETMLSLLTSINLIKKNGQNQWSTKVPLVTDNQMKLIKKNLKPLAWEVAQYLKEEIAIIKKTYEKGKTMADPAWEKIAHLVIDKFIIDATFHAAIGRLEREKGLKRYYSQDQKYIPAFFLELGPNYSTFGTNWYCFKHDGKKREVYILHGALFKRFNFPFNRHRNDQHFSALLHRVSADGRLQFMTESQKQVFQKLGWVTKNRLAVPIIRAIQIKSMLSDLEKIGKGGAEVFFKHFSIIIDSFKNSPYANFMEGGGDYIQVCYHVLFSEIIEQLVKTGVLPPIPESVPEHFGVYITIGSVF